MPVLAEYSLLVAGAFLAAAISGAAGFGGALLLLPLLTHMFGIAEAVPLLTVAQATGNLSRIVGGYRLICWKPVGIFMAMALPFAMLGALSFVALPKELMVRLLGLLILLYVVAKASGYVDFRESRFLLPVGGAAVGLLSGLVGSAGPLGAAIFLTLDLAPAAYIASEAVTAMGIHVAKFIIYGTALHIAPSFWPMAVAMSAAMVGGTIASRWLIERMPIDQFRKFVTVLLIAIALQMIVGA